MVDKKKLHQFEVVCDFIAGIISRKSAAELIGKTERSVSRLVKRVQKKGIAFVLHGNHGKTPANSSDQKVQRHYIRILKEQYFDLNMTHAYEFLLKEHQIPVSYSTLRRWCHAHHHVKHKYVQKRVKRNYRQRCANEGFMIQMDGSHHAWNGKEKWVLIAGIDDATSDIPYAEFFLSEDTINCMIILQKIIEKKGIPRVIYVDRAGWFGGQKRQNFAQFKRACEELNIKVIFANSPQAKGRIERTWRTFQDRLIPEMRIHNIHSIRAANSYLQNEFINGYWASNCKVVPASLISNYQILPANINLKEILCIKETRTVKPDQTISIDNDVYIVVVNWHPYSIHGQQIEIRTYLDLSNKYFFAGREIEIKQIEQKVEKQNDRKLKIIVCSEEEKESQTPFEPKRPQALLTNFRKASGYSK